MEQSVSAFFLTNSIRIRGLYKSHKKYTKPKCIGRKEAFSEKFTCQIIIRHKILCRCFYSVHLFPGCC